jgi:hypothetical protein
MLYWTWAYACDIEGPSEKPPPMPARHITHTARDVRVLTISVVCGREATPRRRTRAARQHI